MTVMASVSERGGRDVGQQLYQRLALARKRGFSALGIAGSSPGVSALLELEGPCVLVVLANTDPPAAGQFMDTTGREIPRAASRGAGEVRLRGGQ
jgi:hypothetical protein